MVQFWYFFFPCREGELFNFGNDFTGPRVHTHRIWSSFPGQRNITLDQSFSVVLFHFESWVSQSNRQDQVLYLVPWLMCENEKKADKKLDTFVCYFCQRKVNIILWSDNKKLNKVVLLLMITSKRKWVWVFILPPKEGLFVINLMPFTQRLWMVFVRHEMQFRGDVLGVNPWGSKQCKA